MFTKVKYVHQYYKQNVYKRFIVLSDDIFERYKNCDIYVTLKNITSTFEIDIY